MKIFFAAVVVVGAVPEFSTAAVVVEADEYGLAAVLVAAVVHADDYCFAPNVVDGAVPDYFTAPTFQDDEDGFAAVVARVVPDYSSASVVVVEADEYGLPAVVVAGAVLDYSTVAVVQADEHGFAAVVVAGAVNDYSTATVDVG